MSFFDTVSEKWQGFSQKTEPFRNFMGKVGRVLMIIGSYIYKLRAVLISIPVVAAAIWLAVRNMQKLPESVGINLLATGDFSMMVTRPVAVFAPLLVTALCVVFTLCSRRTLYPWLISVFTLVLPILIWLTNIYPA